MHFNSFQNTSKNGRDYLKFEASRLLQRALLRKRLRKYLVNFLQILFPNPKKKGHKALKLGMVGDA